MSQIFRGSSGSKVEAGALVSGQPDVRARSTQQNIQPEPTPRADWKEGGLPLRIVRQFNPNTLEFFAGLTHFSTRQNDPDKWLPPVAIPKRYPIRLVLTGVQSAGRAQIPSVQVPLDR